MSSIAVEKNTIPATLPKSVRAETPLFMLGAWLAGLDSFLAGNGTHFNDSGTLAPTGERTREFRLARFALQRCSRLAFDATVARDFPDETGLTHGDLISFAASLRDPLLLSESMERAAVVTEAQWNAWCRLFIESAGSTPGYAKLIAQVESGGLEMVPKLLREKLGNASGEISPEFEAILPRFGRILRLLAIVGLMLEADKPLKPALLIFARVGEMTQALIGYLNQQVERSPSVGDELIGTLDGASYMASIELKKVLQQELAGLMAVRPATSVFARIEASHALLTESFQQILTGFARHIDPEIDAAELFPNFETKRQHSMRLRNDLQLTIERVQAAEADPSEEKVAVLTDWLPKLMGGSVTYLFYKDIETFERFVDEILVTTQKKDLVPILHRFGAYLETLYSQVSMRAVLEQRSAAVSL